MSIPSYATVGGSPACSYLFAGGERRAILQVFFFLPGGGVLRQDAFCTNKNTKKMLSPNMI